MRPDTLSTSVPVAGDQLIALHGVPWKRYEELSRAMGESSGVRTTYLEGEVEIMSPGFQHEYVNWFLGRLVEAFAEARRIPLICAGSLTLRKKKEAAGLEPDTCYFLGPLALVQGKPTRPADLAIEVIVESGTIEKLKVYRRLGVREVWFWEGGKLAICHRGSDGIYKRGRRSRILAGFPVPEAERIIRDTDPSRQTEALREFRESLGSST